MIECFFWGGPGTSVLTLMEFYFGGEAPSELPDFFLVSATSSMVASSVEYDSSEESVESEVVESVVVVEGVRLEVKSDDFGLEVTSEWWISFL